MDLVKSSWEQETEGNPYEIHHEKLKRLKPLLKTFNKAHYSDISDRVLEKRKELESLQFELFNTSSGQNSDKVTLKREKLAELFILERNEESFYRQKSRALWLKESDANTSYFHNMVKKKQKAQTITKLYSREGLKLTNHKDIAIEAISHFKAFMGIKDSNVGKLSIDFVADLLRTSITEDEAIGLI
ncbi:hypothetical protein PTKIN_Ptkin10aG0102200 [Pterospermum kingtungense]